MRPHLLSLRIVRRSATALFLLVALAALGLPIRAQAPTQSNPQETPVKHYAMLFRATRAFTPEEQTQRVADIAAWVKQVTAMGVTLTPHTLGDTVVAYSSEGNHAVPHPGAFDPALANIVLFDSTSEQALEIARLHPAPHYGVTLELREWTAPAPIARPQ